ncbi:hypothetical protein B0O80DRAFT_477274 [Mortierella sp. GBAus27b]|nr:hypothetical protein B0O80DRAFT_477274 [Mortierella sp. GBAus27b]
MPVTSCYAAPRQPIVLCHGLYGFDKMGPDSIPHLQIHYWSGIQKALTKLGAKVIGGLDCRYLISHIHDKNYDVQSLTTVATPHRGSPVMDWFRDNLGVGLLLRSEEEAMRRLGEAARRSRTAVLEASGAFHSMIENAAGRAMSSAKRAAPHANFISPLSDRLIPYLDAPAFANLTTTYCNEVFNPNTPDDPRVSYYSYGGSVPQIPLWTPLGLPWEVIKAKEGDNDGMVSTSSARWGHYVETVEADHYDLSNRRRLKIGYDQKPFDAVELYMNMATRLNKQGF